MNSIYKNKEGDTIDLKSVKRKYFNHWAINKIARHHSCSHQQIGKIVWREIPKRRPIKYKYKIDHNFFDKINNQNSAYILGFLMADGCVSKKSCEISIALHKKDVCVLKFIKKQLKSESNISIKNDVCRVSFYSRVLSEKLKQLGCVPLKSTKLIWNDNVVPGNLIHHFIRGYFDGDGHFSFYFIKGKYLKTHLNIASTLNFCNGLSMFVKNKFGFNVSMSQRRKNSPCRTIELNGNKQVSVFLNWMYKDATICLPRKSEKVKEYLKIYSNNQQ